MARMRGTSFTLGSLLLGASLLCAQAATEYEVVSIRRSPVDAQSAGLQDLPDGTFVMRNQPLRSIIGAASPIPPSEIEGFPDWVARDRYDITAKPPEGSTRQQRMAMMRRMLEDRFRLKGHVEQRERPTFALVLARSDGHLGPQLTPSALDCSAPGPPPRACWKYRRNLRARAVEGLSARLPSCRAVCGSTTWCRSSRTWRDGPSSTAPG